MTNVVSIEDHPKYKHSEFKFDDFWYAETLTEIKDEQKLMSSRMEYQLYVSLYNHHKDAGTHNDEPFMSMKEWLTHQSKKSDS